MRPLHQITDKRIQDFEARHAQRVKTGLSIADLNKAALKRLTNPSEGNMSLYQGSSQKVVKVLSDFSAKGEAMASRLLRQLLLLAPLQLLLLLNQVLNQELLTLNNLALKLMLLLKRVNKVVKMKVSL